MIEPTSRGKEQSWEQEYIERIKNLKSGSRDRLELLTVIAETEAQKRYKRVCNVINKYAKTMKEKYRPAVMYVISNLCMHENVKVRKLYKSRFEREISVIVEKICECRVEQLSVVKRNIERWREREVFEASILDECEYHVQRFEEAAQQAGTENNDNDDNDDDDDDDGGEIIGRFGRGDENATTPEPGSEEEITLNTDNGVEEKKKEETKAVIINKWPKMLQNLAVGGGSVQKKKTKPKKNRNKNNNNMNDDKMLVNNSFRQQNQHQQQQQQQQHHRQQQQQQQQQSSHGQGKAPKKVSQREQNKRANNKKEQQNKQRTGQGAPAKPVSERLTN